MFVLVSFNLRNKMPIVNANKIIMNKFLTTLVNSQSIKNVQFIGIILSTEYIRYAHILNTSAYLSTFHLKESNKEK